MPLASFSAHRLVALLADIGTQPVIGVDTLRDIASALRAVQGELSQPAKQVLAWALATIMQSLCDGYDGEPMTVEASMGIARFVHGPVLDALQNLVGEDIAPDQAILLISTLLQARW